MTFGGHGMTFTKLLALITICSTIVSTNAIDKVIYGKDNRLDLYQVTDFVHYQLARSTAAMFSSSKLKDHGTSVEVMGDSLEERGICEEERFTNQSTGALCTGFLVASDLLLTAGHCIKSVSDCENRTWVFDFNAEHAGQEEFIIPKTSVYGCKEIVSRKLNRSTSHDYALIRLDRPVKDRVPMKVRSTGKIANQAEVVIIGYPSGLPVKVADGARVRYNHKELFFVANTDSFSGNSGSPVIDTHTGTVEGILVRGEQDYTYDEERGCRVPKQCDDFECRGEDVTRVTTIPNLQKLIAAAPQI